MSSFGPTKENIQYLQGSSLLSQQIIPTMPKLNPWQFSILEYCDTSRSIKYKKFLFYAHILGSMSVCSWRKHGQFLCKKLIMFNTCLAWAARCSCELLSIWIIHLLSIAILPPIFLFASPDKTWQQWVWPVGQIGKEN